MAEITLCQLLPPQFRLPSEDPNYVITPILDAFCEMDVELIKPAISGLSDIVNIDETRDIDILLANLGHPFPFIDLSEDKKRSLARALVPMYRLKGTDIGIEQVVLFFLGLVCEVIDFTSESNIWSLGESELGYDTYLSPSVTGDDMFLFLVEFDKCITVEQREHAVQIIDFMKPGWTHYYIHDCVKVLPLIEKFEDVSWL